MSHPSGTHSWYETVAGETYCASCGCHGHETDAQYACPGSKQARERNEIEREFTGRHLIGDMTFW